MTSAMWPLSTLAPGTYSAQAVVRLNPDTHRIGDGPGNAFGPVAQVEIGPEAGAAIPLTINRVVPERPFPESERLRLVDIPSPILSEFHGRPIRQRAAVMLPEAALGADIAVPTLDGGPVTLRVPAGTRSGRTFRVKGRGVPHAKGAGDLLVTVEVAVPAKLSEAERRAVEELAAASDESPRAHLGV